MDVLIGIFLGFHFIGIAALLGGFLYQMGALRTGAARVQPGMLHGALTMLVTGVILVGLREADDADVNNLKVGIKLVILVAILALVYLKRDEEKVPTPLFGTIGLLTLTNIFIATVW